MEVDSISFASSPLISSDAMAATRIQRVWRSNFSHALTKYLAADFLRPNGGITIEYVKSIRCFEAFRLYYTRCY